MLYINITYFFTTKGGKKITIVLNLRQKIDNLWKVFAGGGTILAYQAWLDKINAVSFNFW